MPNIEEAQKAVDNLDKDISPDRVFINAFAVILEACKTAAPAQNPTLQDIIGEFVDKIPGRATLDRLTAIAGRLNFDVMINVISDRNAAIAARNQELQKLAKALGIQIEAIKTDADRLKNIAAEIGKATEAVNTIKTLAAQLGSADANAAAKITAAITALEELGGIF